MIAVSSIALTAMGQPANSGVSTQTVVNPSPLPDSLPIGNEQVASDWIVSEKLLNGKILGTFTPIGVKYLGTNGIEGVWSTDLPGKFSSYSDFESEVSKYGMVLIDKIKNDTKIDHSKPLSMYTYHMYNDARLGAPAVGIFLSKSLGLASDINQETFLGLNVVSRQVVIPITNLERFEVEVDVGSGVPYKYVWTPRSTSQNMTSIGSFKIPKEMTASGYIALQGWYSTGAYKTRLKITAGGESRVYSEQGSLIVPPVLTLSSFGVNVEFTQGRKTIVEASTNLKDWSEIMTIPEDIETNSVWIPFYPGSGSVISSKRFFRAKSL